jgi:hypothetical protein
MNSEAPPSPTEPAVLPHSDASVVLVSENTGDAPAGTENFPFKIPPILLEGDDSETDAIAEDAQKFSLGAEESAEKTEAEGELPASYGTEKLLLTARDPHWLYAHWDLTGQQEHEHRAKSSDGHLRLRVFQNEISGTPINEVQVQPDARHWFVHAERAATNYIAQLGYKKSSGEWTTISSSAPTATPPDAMSLNTNAQFATIPIETPMEKLQSLAQSENLPLTQAIEKLRATGHSELPPTPMLAPWTPEQTAALAQLSGITQIAAMSSLEISSQSAPPFPAPSSVEISSPTITAPAQKKFWFNINAELVIYGSTESDATVTISGKNIELRPDGSFTLRFALPDGEFELPVVAMSADQTDGRSAELKFVRTTQIRGDVGAHPQDPSLKAPGNF